MLILAFETSAKAGSVALLDEKKLLGESYNNTGLTHSQTLMVMAEDLLKQCGKTAADVTAVAVAEGPGSFTGVRIGVAAAKGLGCTDCVTSPTYTIVNEYLSGRMPLFHFDMYRLASADDLWDIGWEDYLERGGICAVEWSENVEDALENAISVTIEKLGEDARRITIEGGDFLADLSL